MKKGVYIKQLTPLAPSSLCTVEFDLTISFLPAISLAIDPSFKKDQEILVLPLDLQKFDTHEKLAQDVLKHFGKVKRTSIYRV